ncbi:hypothetical protein [Mycobacterium servetii]|uniref:Uncharacterized protein n=1 Tax=Mycobacterium servetii TaxID=3237418 RepID=A0ABV4C9D4_9MYCO
MASHLVSQLIARANERSSKKVSTTIRLTGRTFDRLDAQHQRWGASMSEIIEGALVPVLDELEATALPGEQAPPSNHAVAEGDNADA